MITLEQLISKRNSITEEIETIDCHLRRSDQGYKSRMTVDGSHPVFLDSAHSRSILVEIRHNKRDELGKIEAALDAACKTAAGWMGETD